MANIVKQIERIEGAKTDIENAIEEIIGDVIPEDTLLHDYAGYIKAIPSAVFQSLNVGTVGGSGKYIDSIEQKDGKIIPTSNLLPEGCFKLGTVTEITLGQGLAVEGGLSSIKDSGTIHLMAATNNNLGGIKLGYTTSGYNYQVLVDDDNNAFVTVPLILNIFQKHTNEDNSGGYSGLVPAPSYTTTTTRFLREDGSWSEIPLLTAELYVGAEKKMDQSATTNGGTFINLFEAGVCRSVIKLQGNNGILVSSDAFNNITIHSNITSDIVTLNNYNKSTTDSSLADNDTLNTALGKLECKVDNNKGQIKYIMSLLSSIQNQVNHIEDNYVTLATDLTITGEKTFTQFVIANGFVKNDSSDDYVLLGGGGHKALEEFLLEEEFSERELASNVIEESRILKVTSDWMDTGITLDETGTYIVLVSVYANNSTDNMWSCYWSGIMSWYGETTNDTDQYEEILLHRAGHSYNNTIYLRTASGSGSVPLLLLIASNVTMGEDYTFMFKFKRVL